MAKLTINWMELKTVNIGGVDKKLINGTFIDETGAQIEATIWRDDREGKVFPNFDTLAPGMVLEAIPWKHPTKGTYALYAPKEVTTGKTGGNRTAMMEKVMDKKAGQIEEAQKRKEASIEIMSCQRDAVLLTTTFYKDQVIPMSDQEIAEKIEFWREYLQNKLNNPF